MDKYFKLNLELPQSWTKATISDMISAEGLFVDGDWIESKDQDPDGEVRLIQLADIGDGDFRDKSRRFLTLKKTFELGCTFLKEGDVLIARMPDPIGRACLFPLKGDNKFVTAVDVAIVRTGKDGFNHKLLKYFINSLDIRNKIEALQSGTTRKRISRGNLSLIEFPIPPFKEQNRIVFKLNELLSKLEKGKEEINSALKMIKIYRESLLENYFCGRMTEEWRKKHSLIQSSTLLLIEINKSREERYNAELIKFKKNKIKKKPNYPAIIDLSNKESKKLPFLPKVWSWVRLGDICSIVERVNSSDRKFTKDFLYLDIGGIDNEKNKIANHKVYQWANAPSRAQQIVKVGDILFSTVRTYMKNIALVDKPIYNYQIASTGFAVIRPENEFINSNYIFNYVLSNAFIRPLNDLQTGSSYPAVRDLDVFNQQIPICSKAEQDYIVNEIEKTFSICDTLESFIFKTIQECEILKQSILQRAFEGKLVGQDPSDEHANHFLEKIKMERDLFLSLEINLKKFTSYIPNITDMSEQSKSIIELIRKSKKPISPFILWQASEHKDDIDSFYAKLKEHINSGEIVELPRTGKDVLLTTGHIK